MTGSWNDPWFFVALGYTALVLLVGHWIPWGPGPEQGDKIGQDEQRIWNYVYGVGALMSGLLLWFLPNGWFARWLQICAFPVVGGIIVIVAYQWDLRQNVKAISRAERERGRLGEVE